MYDARESQVNNRVISTPKTMFACRTVSGMSRRETADRLWRVIPEYSCFITIFATDACCRRRHDPGPDPAKATMYATLPERIARTIAHWYLVPGKRSSQRKEHSASYLLKISARWSTIAIGKLFSNFLTVAKRGRVENE